MKKKVIVIGGGIIGLCSAYYLVKDGNEVVVLDKSNFSEGASYVNAGYLTPSHFIPLAAPGVIKKGIKWMFDPSSPFYMKPRLDPGFLKWLWYFNKSSTLKKVKKSIGPLLEINLLSRDLYHEMADGGDLGEFHLERNGILMFHRTNKEKMVEGEIAVKAKQLGLDVRTVSKEELQEMEPSVKLDVAGAYHYLCDGHMTPGDFMYTLREHLISIGVSIMPDSEVTEMKISGNRLVAVMTGEKKWMADEFVMAAGSWSSIISRKLDVDIPLQAGKGYCIDCYEDTGIKMPAILSEAKVAVTPMDGFTRFAGTMEFSGINDKVNRRRVVAIADAVKKYYPEIHIPESAISNARSGLRPVSPDGMPYIGRSDKYLNLLISTGHAMMGWCLGPATGKIIAELVSNKKTSMDISAFDPGRRF